jgi:dCTP deaminase
MILSYQSVKRLCKDIALITPLAERTIINGKTYGLSSCGYDIRCAEEFFLEPGEFRLTSSVEHFNMPNYLVATVNDKSSWARKGLAIQNTVIEPGWRGYLTLELSNHHNTQALWIQAGDPIAQILFQVLDEPTEMPYTGKYQDQKSGPQPAIEEK